ncbi:MAG: hypothetical protein HFI67_07770 [Lachnospiraceae bacterium]|jgi:hypothetical protein|nr:hypothetical protein [Lachnospiraceae bacterium]
MAENKYFKQALSNFMLDAAGGGAVRHLVKQGLTVSQIMGRLDFPLPYEKVRQMVWEALTEQRTVLLEEPGTRKAEKKALYVKEQGEFGRTSFRRILIPEEDYSRTTWNETEYGKEDGTEFKRALREEGTENGWESAYVSWDLGILQAKTPDQAWKFLETFDERQREYVEGLPWPRRRVYHRLDTRFQEILERLLLQKRYEGECWFLKTGNKLIIK